MTMFSGMALGTAYIAAGVFVTVFCHELATALNAFSVKFYEKFPGLKKRIPLSRFAGTQRNYKSSLIYFRILGFLLLAGGTVMLGIVLVVRR